MSAALGLSQLQKLPKHNQQRNRNHLQLSHCLEELGFETFLAPAHMERVYFEFLIRHRDPSYDVGALIERLQAAGAQVAVPRYPLLHQQPFFTEGHWQTTCRAPGAAMPQVELPNTERENARLIRLPNFPGENNGILEQYADAFAALT